MWFTFNAFVCCSLWTTTKQIHTHQFNWLYAEDTTDAHPLSILFESECVVLYQTTFQTYFYCFSASLFSKSPNLNLSIDAAKHCKSSIMAFILFACTDILFCTTRLLVWKEDGHSHLHTHQFDHVCWNCSQMVFSMNNKFTLIWYVRIVHFWFHMLNNVQCSCSCTKFIYLTFNFLLFFPSPAANWIFLFARKKHNLVSLAKAQLWQY